MLITLEPRKALATGAMIGSGLWLFGTPVLSVLGISIGAFLLLGGWKFMKNLQTFPRDFRALKTVLVVLINLRHYVAKKTTIPDMFVCTVAKHKDKAAILYEDEVWTFQDLENYSNAVANYFRNEGYAYGDSVAIVLENSPEYVGLWLGMAKIGVHAALINTNLRGDALLHCMTISDAKAVVYGKQFAATVAAIASSLAGDENTEKRDFKMMCVHGYSSEIPDAINLDEKLETTSKLPHNIGQFEKSFTGTLFYIYTSGTTGLPKPAIINHSRALKTVLVVLRNIRHYVAEKTTIPDLFVRTVAKHKDKAAILYEDEVWTFQDLENYSNAVANYFRNEGYGYGDSVAIVLENSPEYVGLWLGMAKIGVHAALINTNLRGDALLHCVTISDAKAVVYGKQFATAIAAIASSLAGDETTGKRDFRMMCVRGYSSDIPDAINLDEKLETTSKLPPNNGQFEKSFAGTLFFIYTSGTTGLPKPAIIKHSRYFYMCQGMGRCFNFAESDIIYTALPLYHTNANILAMGQMITCGCTIALRKKFSASNFWNDCIKYQCTVIQYIGEICRFLLAQPAKPVDTQHSVRIAYGNGLRAHIWEEFKNRFQITQIREFYGATEGNAALLNTTGKVGAVGFLSVLVPAAYPIKIIRIDPDTNEPVRNSSGLCELVAYNEPGELIGKITERDLLREFTGYKGLENQTQKKVLRDVLKTGDKFFRTGDFVKMDEEGYVYFTDRTGDTFRWRGENVSTTEIENTASKIIKNLQVACYGVEIPGAEGRAGMIAIVHQDDINLADLCRELQERLPTYAVPLFVRVVEKLEYTATEKIIKRKLREEGFDIKHIVDPLYFMDPVSKTYIPLSEDVYKKIIDKEYKF